MTVGEFGAWRLEFEDGSRLAASAWKGTVSESAQGGVTRRDWRSPDLDVTVTAEPAGDGRRDFRISLVNRGVKAVLATALVPYLIGCAYIVLSLLKVDNLAVPMRLVSWVVASPYWPCILPWTHTFDRLTGAVAAVLMISPFVMPLVTFAGYMQGPKLWAKSEKAMAEGKRRAKAKSRVVRKKRVPRSQRPEI